MSKFAPLAPFMAQVGDLKMVRGVLGMAARRPGCCAAHGGSKSELEERRAVAQILSTLILSRQNILRNYLLPKIT